MFLQGISLDIGPQGANQKMYFTFHRPEDRTLWPQSDVQTDILCCVYRQMVASPLKPKARCPDFISVEKKLNNLNPNWLGLGRPKQLHTLLILPDFVQWLRPSRNRDNGCTLLFQFYSWNGFDSRLMTQFNNVQSLQCLHITVHNITQAHNGCFPAVPFNSSILPA